MSEGYPLLTTKKIPFPLVFAEWKWIMSGSTDVRDLQALGAHFWDRWALTEDDVKERGLPESYTGSIGPLYGEMLRHWPTQTPGVTVDQISYLFNSLKERPLSRRILSSTWNPALLPDEGVSPLDNVAAGKQALAPCHPFMQFRTAPLLVHERMNILYGTRMTQAEAAAMSDVEIIRMTERLDAGGVPKYNLDLWMYARSQDLPIGTPFNIAFYSLMLLVFAKQLNMVAGTYYHDMGDIHIYEGQMPFVPTQLARVPKKLPQLKIRDGVASIFDYTLEDFVLEGYHPDKHIPYPVYE